MSINIEYDPDFYSNFTGIDSNSNLIKNEEVNYNEIKNNLTEKIMSLRKELEFKLRNVTNIQESNEKFLSLQGGDSAITVHKSKKIEMYCSEEKRRLMNGLLNLSPENISRFYTAKNDYLQCLKRNKI